MERKERTTAELKKASNHLNYEFWMLSSLAQAIVSGMAVGGWLSNALLESFVIHVRGIMDFFYNDNPRKDDVAAQDFFRELNEWKNIRPQLPGLLKLAKNRAHKEVAHLTYARLEVTPETKPWPVKEITNEVSTIMQTFINRVPKEKLGSRWDAKTME